MNSLGQGLPAFVQRLARRLPEPPRGTRHRETSHHPPPGALTWCQGAELGPGSAPSSRTMSHSSLCLGFPIWEMGMQWVHLQPPAGLGGFAFNTALPLSKGERLCSPPSPCERRGERLSALGEKPVLGPERLERIVPGAGARGECEGISSRTCCLESPSSQRADGVQPRGCWSVSGLAGRGFYCGWVEGDLAVHMGVGWDCGALAEPRAGVTGVQCVH